MLVTIISLILLLIIIFPVILTKVLMIALKKLYFRIEMENLFEYKNIYICLQLKSKLALISPLKLRISSISFKRIPNTLKFQIIIEKIHLKAHLSEIDLKPLYKNKMDEIFTINLMKIFEFTQNYLFSDYNILSIHKNSKINVKKANNSFNGSSFFSRLLGLIILSRISFKIKKTRFDFIENSKGINLREFDDPYEKIILRTKIYSSFFLCSYDTKVIFF